MGSFYKKKGHFQVWKYTLLYIYAALESFMDIPVKLLNVACNSPEYDVEICGTFHRKNSHVPRKKFERSGEKFGALQKKNSNARIFSAERSKKISGTLQKNLRHVPQIFLLVFCVSLPYRYVPDRRCRRAVSACHLCSFLGISRVFFVFCESFSAFYESF